MLCPTPSGPSEEDPEFTRTRLPGRVPGKELCAAGPIPRSSGSGNAEKARNPACQAPGPSAPAFGCRKRAGGNALPVGGKSRSCSIAASQAAESCHRRSAPLAAAPARRQCGSRVAGILQAPLRLPRRREGGLGPRALLEGATC
ncbi:hypothetical protein I79_010515 [Cricetulus griseus]|uniref:Uncharacterized protein n=1 Tax=Cricetulus griseus TaxID=10029 RepID=G3HIP0_CRIGR|nr:hypothetical protein I79_010515 [Cricetulus griseus]